MDLGTLILTCNRKSGSNSTRILVLHADTSRNTHSFSWSRAVAIDNLLDAVKSKDLNKVRAATEAGADVDSIDEVSRELQMPNI